MVRRSFEALAAGDLDRLFECFTEDCVFDGSRVAEGVYEGEANYRSFLQGALDTVRPRHEVRLDAGGEHVLAIGKLIGVGQTSGATMEMPVAYLYRLRDGRIEHQTMFTDGDEARAAFREASREQSPR